MAQGVETVADRDRTRLLRLLRVIDDPVDAPEPRLHRFLAGLAEVFTAEITALVHTDALGWEVITAWGFPETEERRLPPLPGADDFLTGRGPGVWECAGDRPMPVAGIEVRAAACARLDPEAPAGPALVVLRSRPGPFEASEVETLRTVAARWRSAVREEERRDAMERLAHVGPRFARHRTLDPLLDAALAELTALTGAEAACALTVRDGVAEVRREHGPSLHGPWPRALDRLMAAPAARQGRAWVCPDLFDVARDVRGREPAWVRSLACLPVLQDGAPVILLYAGHSHPGWFSRPGIEAASVLAGWLGPALANVGLHQHLSQTEGRLRELTDELGRQATHDPLTGLANRELARQALERGLASNAAGMVGLLFCDLDKFKAINDRLGHEAGDELLREVATRLAGCLRTGDVLARLGGDEFIIVLPVVADLVALTQIGRRVLQTLDEPFVLRGESVRVGASIGGVMSEREPGRDRAVDLLRDADAAMYAAKNRGRGRVEVFDRFTAQRAVDRLRLREDLLTALDAGEMELHYQPIVDLDDERVTGFEALLRWNHASLGRISPADFIPMAEETGAITAIGDWVLAEACRRLAQWHAEFGAVLSMAVNVSAVQLLDPGFAQRCIRTIRATGLSNRHVWLEVTENIEVTSQLIDQLRMLRDVGVRVAMDDFGMSYSNLGYLKHLPVERLKIDQSFVAGLGAATADGIDRGIVRAILAIAESAGMSVVAEGVETEEQRQVLRDLGCHRGQGFLFARPMPAEDADALLAEATNLLTEAAEAAVGRLAG
jgi:diguanylate cyclase (GGDEF)-like protein